MVDTPTRKSGRRKRVYGLRRRIIKSSEDDDSQNTSSGKENEESLSAESSSDRSITLRSTSRRLSVTQPQHTFYKSVCTPSRANTNRGSVAPKSSYRTPLISSTVKKPYTSEKKKKVPQGIVTKWEEDVKKILNKTWKFCYLSSVFKFNIGNSRLKAAYERTLKDRILKSYPSYHLVVQFSISSFLSQNAEKVDAVFLHVTSLKPGEDSDNDKMVTVYHGVLIKAQETTQSKACRGVNWFPLLLYSGLELLHNTFILWLQASFDCYITPRCLPASTLLWLTAIWSYGKCTNKHHGRQDRKISLKYQIRLPEVPTFNSSRGRGKFVTKLGLQPKALMEIWTKIKKNKQSEPTVDDLPKFHIAIDSIMETVTHIPKSLFCLVEVQTPCITVSSAGKLRLTCKTTFLSLLHHLIEIFQSTCHFRNLEDEMEDEWDSEEESDK